MPIRIIRYRPFLPAAAMHAGIDTRHFGVVAPPGVSIGLLTPPLGVCLLGTRRSPVPDFTLRLSRLLDF